VKVLLVGAAGQHARQVARRLLAADHEVVGIDSRPWPTAPRELEMCQVDVRKRPAADVFRRHRPEVVIHMGTVTHFDVSPEKRFRINLRGTQAVLDRCHDYGVRHVVFVSRHTVYGAAPDAPLYRTEDEPPMAGSTFPELSDLVAADLYAASALWRFPELETVVLRMVYLLGRTRSGTLASFIKGPRVPGVLGFDPLFQFMHEQDAAEAITRAAEEKLRGVFNVAGPQPVPLSVLCRETGRQRIPIPERLIKRALGRFGMPHLPRGAVPHLKHPVVIDDAAFREATGFQHRFDEYETMRDFAEDPR
jgi:UDP-glucose 4-epimerase